MATSSSGTRGTWEPEGLDDPAAVAGGRGAQARRSAASACAAGSCSSARTASTRPGKTGCSSTSRARTVTRTGTSVTIPTSVLSGLTNEEIAARRAPPTRADAGAAIHGGYRPLRRPAGRRCPTSSRPCWRRPWTGPSATPDWLFELKLDGYRVQAVVQGHAVQLRTREGKDAAALLPGLRGGTCHLDRRVRAPSWTARWWRWTRTAGPASACCRSWPACAGLGVKRGERRAGAGHGLQSAGPTDGPAGTLVYHAFDLLHLDSWDLLDVPLEERKRLLRLVLREPPLGALRQPRRRSTARTSSGPSSSRAWRAASPSCARAAMSPASARDRG